MKIRSAESDGLILFLPEELDHKPVRAIGERAFVNQKFGEVRFPKSLRRIESRAFSGCLGLENISFPEGLTYIGPHAFTNCENLQEISFCGNLAHVDDCAFLHCVGLKKICFDDSTGDYLGLAQVVKQLQQEVEVEVSGKNSFRMLFTDFTAYDEENGPAHLFQFHVDGCGQFYRRCIGANGIDFKQYDELLKIAVMKDAPESVMRVACYRLTEPFGLSALARDRYLNYLRERREEVCRCAIAHDDLDLLEKFTEWGVFGEDLVENLTDFAHSRGKFGCLSWLMNRRGEQNAWDDDKDFDL